MPLLKQKLILIAAAIYFPINALAVTESNYFIKDGNDLLAVCNDLIVSLDQGQSPSEKQTLSAIVCTSYLRGFSHGVAVMSNEPEQGNKYCIASSIPMAEIVRVLVKYLKENPKILNYHPGVLVNRAFQEGFPCNQ